MVYQFSFLFSELSQQVSTFYFIVICVLSHLHLLVHPFPNTFTPIILFQPHDMLGGRTGRYNYTHSMETTELSG